MFTLQLDKAGLKHLGFTLRTPDGQSLLFKTMDQVMEFVSNIEPDQLAWHSLNCAMNWWESEEADPFWGEFSTSREVQFWDWARGEARTQTIRRGPRIWN